MVICKILDEPVIGPIHEYRGDQEICCRPVAGCRNIPHQSNPEQRFYIRVVGLGFQRIPKENQKVNFTFGDMGTNLLIPAQRAALKFCNGHLQFRLHQPSGGAGSKNIMPLQNGLVPLSPFDQIILFVVMRH